MGGTGVCKDGMEREDLLSAAEESGTQQRLWAFLFLGKVAGAGGAGGAGSEPLPKTWVMIASADWFAALATKTGFSY